MNKFYIIYIIIHFLFASCVKQTSHSKRINENNTSKQTYFSQWFSSIEMENIAKCSGEGIDMMFKKADTLDIGSGGELVYMPFGTNNFSIDSIRNKIGNLFSETERFEVDNTGLKRRIILLKYKDSFIKFIVLKNNDFPLDSVEMAEYHYKKPDSVRIVSAKISDSEIRLIYGIKVGISKIEFFNKIFPKCNIDILKDINIILNEDTQGEYLQQMFIFEDDKLTNVIMQMPDPFVSLCSP